MLHWFREEKSLPVDFNGPAEVPFTAFEPAWVCQPLIERFRESAHKHADRVAIGDSRGEVSYAALLEQVDALARCIARSTALDGFGPVGITLAQSTHFPLAALACLAAGRPYVPVDMRYPAARIQTVLQDAGANLLLAEDSDAAIAVPDSIRVIVTSAISTKEGLDAEAGSQLGAPVPQPAAVTAPAVILYTSGSTGKPKGICNDQRAILQRVAEATNASHLNPDDRMILLSSPGTIAGEREMFAALLNGASLYMSDPQNDGLHGVLRTCSENRITVCYMVPALFRMLLRAPGAAAALSHLRVLRIGGDITLASDLALFRAVAPARCHFFASFSATEMPAVFQWFVPPDFVPDGTRVPVGYPRPEVDFIALNEEEKPVSTSETGELIVRSEYLALGQWQDGRLQPGAFTADPDQPSLRILRTGDMVRPRPDGLWELTGRRDRQIKIHGQRVDVGEVEAVLRSCPEIDDVAVIARQKDEQTVALVAFVALRQRGAARTAMAEGIRDLLEKKLPRFMQPAAIHFLPSIPQLPGFKPDVAALRRMDCDLQRDDEMRQQRASRGASSGGWAERSAARDADRNNVLNSVEKRGDRTDRDDAQAISARVEDAVKHGWSMVLGASSWRLDLPFDRSGGDSLKALELWFHIEEALGFRLALDALGATTQPSQLQQELIRVVTAQQRPAALTQASTEDGTPLIYLVPGILGDDPVQLRFRGAFGDSVRFKLIDYPAWRETMATDCSFEAIIDAAYSQVCADPPQAVYRLAGYSYGGIVAFELARRLIESGRNVGMLALLDTRRWDLADTRPLFQQDAMLPEPNFHSRMLAGLITVLVRQRRYSLLTLTLTQLTRRASRLAFRFRNRMTKDLRFEALRRWNARPLNVAATLYVSTTQWPGEPEGYGWKSLCDSVTVVPVGGTHASMIDRPGRDKIASHIRQALSENVGQWMSDYGGQRQQVQ